MILKNTKTDFLQSILKDFNIGKIIEYKPLPTSGNITYTILTETGKFLLRLCPDGPRFRSKEEIDAELELIDHLNQNHFPAPKPIIKTTGQRIIEFQGKFGYLRKFDDGQSITTPNLTQIEKFGQTLGWFHSLTENFNTKKSRDHIFNPEETLKNFRLNKNFILNSNFKNAKSFVEKVQSELLQMSFPNKIPQGMIHEDLGKRHVLWKKNEISCVIDFDRCYFGKLILDLGQAVRGWCVADDWFDWSNDNLKSLISGYQQKRKLTPEEKECLLPATKFAVLERSISFCMKYLEVTHDPEDEKYSYQSAFDFLDILENNKNQINDILKA